MKMPVDLFSSFEYSRSHGYWIGLPNTWPCDSGSELPTRHGNAPFEKAHIGMTRQAGLFSRVEFASNLRMVVDA
jgi:hypothetical protein